MKTLFKPWTFQWWEIGFVKLSLLAIGIGIGAYWHAFFLPYAWWIAGVGLIVGLYFASVKLSK